MKKTSVKALPAKQAKPVKRVPPKRATVRWKMLAFYFDNVVPFLAMPSMDLERALGTGVNMFQYEFHTEYRKLKLEARRVLENGSIDEIVELARTKKLPGLDHATASKMLKDIAEAGDERFEGAGE